MTPIRVLHLVESLGLGGLETMVATLARRADPGRIQVEVACLSSGGTVARQLESEAFRVDLLRLSGYYPFDLLRAARHFRSRRPDVVHAHGHVAGVVARAAAALSGVPAVVHHLHTLDTTLKRRHLRLERALAPLTRRILCCSAAVERFAAAIMQLPASLLLTVPNGIEPGPRVDAAEARRLLNTPPGPILGCVGGLAPHKGQEILLRAVGLLAAEGFPGTLVLVGDGPERPGLERLARQQGLAGRALFLGERPDARSLLPAFDVAVVPSRGREGLGIAALEAMDAGLPVVASRLGGLPEVVQEGRTGLLVPPDDPASLAAALQDLLGRPDRGRALGEAGRRRVASEFRAALMARRVEAVYDEALRARRAA